MPKVSVIIPAYNQARFLAVAIDSVLQQTYRDLEVLVVDDGSTDETRDVAARFGDRINYIHQENTGLPGARNRGILEASGEFLCFLDSDDFYHPEKIRRQVELLEADPKIGFVYCDIVTTDESGEPLAEQCSVNSPARQMSGNIFQTLMMAGYFPPHTVLIRRAVLDAVGHFDPALGGNADYDLWLRASAAGHKACYIDERLAYYRTYSTSMSQDGQRMAETRLATFQKICRLHPGLVAQSLHHLQRSNQDLFLAVRWRSLLEAGRILKGLKQNPAAVQSYLEAVKAAEASKHPLLILEALIEIGAGLVELDSNRASQLLRMALQLAEKIRCQPAEKKARQLLAAIGSQVPERPNPTPRERGDSSPLSEGDLSPSESPTFSFSIATETPHALSGAGASSRPESVPDPLVSIVIPAFNNLPLTEQCLEAIRAHTAIPYEMIVVDNASTDGTREYLCQEQASGRARLIFNSDNLGFAHASNQGARAAQGEFVLFLNNDTVPQSGWLEPLAHLLASDPSVAAAGSKLLYPDGSLQHAGIVICHDEKAQDPLLARLLYRGEPGDLPDANTARQFQALTAACLLVRKSAFVLVEGFDEGYWNGYEDVDLCFKLRERNWKLVYQPASVVTHQESKSGPERFAKAQQNILRLHQKWLGKIQPDIVVKENGEAQVSATSVIRTSVAGGAAAPFHARSQGAPATSIGSPATNQPVISASESPVPRVSIIVLTWNNLSFTRQCLDSIQRHTADFELIVVDNGSTDGTCDYLRTLQQQQRNLRVIANRTNRGFAAGNNQGIALARGENILLLNNDTVVTPGWLDRMLSVLECYPDVGLVGPVSNCVSGPQRVLEVSYKDLSELPAFVAHRAQRMAGQSGDATRLVAFCLLARRGVIEGIGGLDERFGSGNFEDDDFCLRAFSLGFKARVAQDAFVHHAGSQTFKSARINYHDAMTANWRLFKSKWRIPADSPIELGYRLPAQLAPGESIKIALPTLALDHEPDAGKNWWQECTPLYRTAVPPVPSGGSPANMNVSVSPAPPGGAPPPPVAPAIARLELPAVARLGSLQPATELLRQKQLPEAWNSALQALQLRPFHPECYLLLGEISKAAGDFNQARRCADRACHMAPGLKPARKFLKSLPGASKHPGLSWTPLPDGSLPPRLSVCLIVRNEEKFLDQCLRSVRGLAQQIIVVDTGSTDRTIAIAQQHGAEVHSFAWVDDFSAARNSALEHATGDWILILDADEELLPEGRDLLKKEIQAQPVMAFRLPIVDAGKEDEGCSYVPRLFRNAPGLFFVGRVHEQVFTSIEVRRQEWGLENRLGKAAIRHHRYTSEVTRDRNKIDRNLALLKKAMEETPNEPNLLMNYGLELVRSGNLRAGLDHYRQAFQSMTALPASQISPELRETLLTQFSTQLLKSKDFSGVIGLLASPLAKSGRLTASLHFTHGLALMELKRFPDAAEQMRQCIARRNRPALSPINREIRQAGPSHCLALCLNMMGQGTQAAKAFADAVNEEPNSIPLRLDYARFLVGAGQAVEALQSLHQLIADKPGEAPVWLLGGEIALAQPQFLEFARDWTGEAIKYFPQAQPIVLQRAEALLLSAEVEHALPLWRQASDASNPRYLAALFLCEFLSDCECLVPPHLEPAVSQEFLKWYRALLGVGQAGLLRAINTRFEKLRSVLPLASRALEQALAEAGQEVPINDAATPAATA